MATRFWTSVFGVIVTVVGLMSATRASASRIDPAPPAAPPVCASANVAPAAGTPRPLIAANNAFAFNLFQRLRARRPYGNVFLSPTSISLALEMLYDGARGDTQRQMARTLHLRGLSPRQARLDAAQWIRLLQYHRPLPPPGMPATPDAYLQVSNSLWTHRPASVQQSFASDLSRYFGARAAALDFASPEALAAINGWVSCSTHGAIPTIVNSLDPGALMYLINAVYFKGQWVNQFAVRDTHPHVFMTSGNRRITVPMMHEGGTYLYYQARDFQMVSLPYDGGRYSMEVLLPRPGLTVQTFVPRLTRAGWGYWMAQLSRSSRPGIVNLPRFQLSYSTSLNDVLKALGMTRAFQATADFRGACTGPCFVSQVLHKTYLRVNEKGTVAAAVTAIGLAGGGANPAPPFTMTVDRPFVVAIRDDRNGAIPFLGVVNNPVG